MTCSHLINFGLCIVIALSAALSAFMVGAFCATGDIMVLIASSNMLVIGGWSLYALSLRVSP